MLFLILLVSSVSGQVYIGSPPVLLTRQTGNLVGSYIVNCNTYPACGSVCWIDEGEDFLVQPSVDIYLSSVKLRIHWCSLPRTVNDTLVASYDPIQLSDQTVIAATVRSPPFPIFTSVALGDYHGCGLSYGNQVWCWGSNERCQIGSGYSGTYYPYMTEVTFPTTITPNSIVAYANTTCVSSLDKVVCWGAVASLPLNTSCSTSGYAWFGFNTRGGLSPGYDGILLLNDGVFYYTGILPAELNTGSVQLVAWSEYPVIVITTPLLNGDIFGFNDGFIIRTLNNWQLILGNGTILNGPGLIPIEPEFIDWQCTQDMTCSDTYGAYTVYNTTAVTRFGACNITQYVISCFGFDMAPGPIPGSPPTPAVVNYTAGCLGRVSYMNQTILATTATQTVQGLDVITCVTKQWYQSTNDPDIPAATMIGVGNEHTCVLLSNGSAYCQGSTDNYQYLTNTYGDDKLYNLLWSPQLVSELYVEGDTTCLLFDDGLNFLCTGPTVGYVKETVTVSSFIMDLSIMDDQVCYTLQSGNQYCSMGIDQWMPTTYSVNHTQPAICSVTNSSSVRCPTLGLFGQNVSQVAANPQLTRLAFILSDGTFCVMNNTDYRYCVSPWVLQTLSTTDSPVITRNRSSTLSPTLFNLFVYSIVIIGCLTLVVGVITVFKYN